MFYVFDLDGTLADATHRLHYIEQEPKDWLGFFREVNHDTPIVQIVELMRVLVNAGHRVEIWTGRSENTREATEAWLYRAGVPRVPMMMRKSGDKREDYVVKAEWLPGCGKSVLFRGVPIRWDGTPDMIFEDRQAMVDMWRPHGVRVAQVAEGKY